MKEETYSLSQKTKDFLADEFGKCDYPKQFYPLFEEKYRGYIEDEEYDTGIIDNHALNLSKLYIETIVDQLRLGHSFDWAESYAAYREDDRIRVVFSELRKINEDLAIQEVQIHAKSFGKDKYFEKYYIELVTEDVKSDDELEQLSTQYSTIIQRSIAEGNSLCYAQKYAELKMLCESPVVEASVKLIAEIYDFADKNGIDTSDIYNNCSDFANDCDEAYADERFPSIIGKLRETYKEAWQQEMLTILYNRYMDEYYDYQDTVEYSKPTKKSLIEDTWDRMFPDGIDDGFTGIINDD